MLIYCTGDSYTEGSGLADAVMFPDDFPGLIDNANPDSASKSIWTNKRSSLIARDAFVFEKLRQENLKRAWPSQLANITGHKVINGGVGGATMQSMAMTLIHDIESIISQNNTIDKVFISLTGIERIPILNTYPIKDYIPLAFNHALHPKFLGHVGVKYHGYCNGFWESHSPEEMLTFYLYHCINMKNYVLYKTGITPMFLQSKPNAWEEIVQQSHIFLLKEYWEMLEFNKLNSYKSLSDFSDSVRLPDGHFREESHKAFATYIGDEFL
jgi:hypothetical protein